MKRLPGTRFESAPISLGEIFSGQIEEELGLNRIGVLEFVHKQALIAILKCLTDGGMVPNEGRRPRQKVLERHLSGQAPLVFIVDGRLVQETGDPGDTGSAAIRKAPASEQSSEAEEGGRLSRFERRPRSGASS